MSKLAKKGSKLEMLIDMTNNQYKHSNFADVRKVPTPLKIASVKGKQVNAYLDKATWVDYSGIYKGRAIIFDAKESTIERFSLANLADHQYDQLKSWHRHGATAFLVIAFWLKNKNEPEIYYLTFEQLAAYWEKKDSGGFKSIPINYFRDKCTRINGKDGFTAHYLSATGL